MIKPICERGKKYVYLKVEIEEYYYPLSARSQFTVREKRLVYYCNKPKRFDKWQLPKALTHKEKFKKCGSKVTNKLEEYIKG